MSNFKLYKMKKIFITAITGILITASLSSCTQEDILMDELLEETTACCGEGPIDPPPPPPPPPPPEVGSGG